MGMRTSGSLAAAVLLVFILTLLNGCLPGDDLNLSVAPPTAAFVATPDAGVAPLTVNFDASESLDPNGEALTYTWEFGDGQKGSGVSTSHTYQRMGIYTARLQVQNNSGLTAEAEQDILVAKSVSYDDLFRHNESYVGDLVYYRGEIIQVQSKLFGGYVWRVATRNTIFGYIDDVIWVNYSGPRFLEGDVIDVFGKVKGLRTYIAVLGNEVTIPEIDALRVYLIKKAGE